MNTSILNVGFKDVGKAIGDTKLKNAVNYFSDFLAHELIEHLTFDSWYDIPSDFDIAELLGQFSDFISREKKT